MRFEGFFASFSPSLDPVAHRSLAYSQSHGYVFLLPAFLFQFPRSFSSFFPPIGFLWCSHASYRITLDFLLPRSVVGLDNVQEKREYLIFPKSERNMSILRQRELLAIPTSPIVYYLEEE